jgi:hypothetical protein
VEAHLIFISNKLDDPVEVVICSDMCKVLHGLKTIQVKSIGIYKESLSSANLVIELIVSHEPASGTSSRRVTLFGCPKRKKGEEEIHYLKRHHTSTSKHISKEKKQQ